jgi:hypothetical protein
MALALGELVKCPGPVGKSTASWRLGLAKGAAEASPHCALWGLVLLQRSRAGYAACRARLCRRPSEAVGLAQKAERMLGLAAVR